MGGWVDGWMGGWVDGWMGGWVDGWMGRDARFCVSTPEGRHVATLLYRVGNRRIKGNGMSEMNEYRQTMRLREAAIQQQQQRRLTIAWQVTRQASTHLKQTFQASQVWVFGSLVHQQWFSLTSDIDLAVVGISAWDHLAAVATLQDLSDFQVDLVRLETCPEALRTTIARTGQVI